MSFIITYSIHTYLHRLTLPLLQQQQQLLLLLLLLLLIHTPDSNQCLVVQPVSSYCINSLIPFHSVVITDDKSTFQCDTSVNVTHQSLFGISLLLVARHMLDHFCARSLLICLILNWNAK
jgi:hypothetical protein